MGQMGDIIQQEKELAVGDEMIINTPASYTRYKILEISKTAQNPRVRFERVEGGIKYHDETIWGKLHPQATPSFSSAMY